MSDFQMDTEQVRSAADTVHQLSANMSEFKLKKASPFAVDTGDAAVGAALVYFTDMDDEIAETFKSIISKL